VGFELKDVIPILKGRGKEKVEKGTLLLQE